MQKVSQWVGMSLVGLFVLATTASGAGYKMKIEFPGYDNRTEALTNFPVLVVVSNDVDGSGFSFENTPFLSDEGWDLRFRDTDETTELNYEIESWDTNNASYVWVQVPELPADGSGHIWAYWGEDDTQQACTTNGAVWSEGYLAVWHKGDATASTISDSSINEMSGTKKGSGEPLETDGIVGKAQDYDGSDDYVNIGASSFYIPDDNSVLTVTAWFYPHSIGSDDYANRAITIYKGSSSSGFILGFDNSNQAFYYDGGGRQQFGGTFPANQWYAMSVVFDGSASQKYQGGSPDGDSVSHTLNEGYSDAAQLGTGAGGKDYKGLLDEVRFSNVARSADWVWADYMTVASNTVFSDYGSVAPLDADTPFIATAVASGLATNGATLNGRLSSTGASVTAVSVYWEQTDTDQGTNTTDWANEESFGDYTSALGELPYEYATNITGLVAGTQYTYRYYATNDAGEAWGEAESFTTYETPGQPTIDAPSETGFVHVVISGAVNGGTPDPLAYFCLNAGSDGGTGSTGDWDIVESAGTQSGAFTNMITGLQDDTNYYARVYVTNEAGAAWSDPVSFSTEATPAQLTLEADQVIDGASPSIVFKEAPDSPLNGIGASPDWLYDFAYYGGVQTVDLDAYTLKATGTPSSVGTISFNMAGASLIGTNALGIRTYKGTEKQHGHHVVITNVNEIAMGGIDTHQEKTSGGDADRNSGNIDIGSSADPAAGGIQIGYLHTYTGGGNGGNAGNIMIYGNEDVLIKDNTDSPGDILTYASDSEEFPGGDVTVLHDGAFLARNIVTYTRCSSGNDSGGASQKRSGQITLDGGSATGDARVTGYIQTMHPFAGKNSTQSFIRFENYENVTLEGDILAQYDGVGFYNTRSTDLTITNNITGDIDIQGAINLWASAVPANNGRLELACDGSITLATLSLGKVQYAALGAATNFIEGVIYGTDGDYLAGDGTDLSNAAGDSVRAPSNSVVYYNPTVNPALQGATYTLADLDGNEGDGGTFEPAPTTPFIAAAHQDLTETSVELVGTLSSTGTSTTTVSVYWGSEDGGTDTWANTNTWAAHTDSDPLPLDYTNALAGLTAGQDLYYCFAASNAGGKVWTPVESVVMEWSGDTLTIAGDQIVDDESDPISFVEIPGVLNARGDFHSGATTYPPWTYEFADVYLGPGRVLDLSTNKLYCATQNGQRADVALDLNGANLSGESGTNISTYISSGNYSDIVVISNVADIAMGGIDAHGRNTSGDFSTFAGGIEIGTASQPAGSIRVDFLWAFSTGGRSSAGPITVYGNGNVHIENSTGEPGDIDTSSQALNSSSIFVEHQGELRVRDILDDTTGTSSGGSRAGDITLNGGDASGDATIRNINASITGGNYGGGSKHTITIRNYNNVSVSNITATGWEASPGGNGRHAANVVMEDIAGDIDLAGDVDLYADESTTRTGNMQLSCTGTVTLAELDLDRMLYAALSSGSGESRITGVVTNFDATSTGGSGTESDPYTTAETRLRAPEGQVVYYEYSAGSLNDDLGGDVWQLRNLDDSGDGGLLMVEPPSGTIFIVR